MFSQKIRSADDDPNKSYEQDNLHDNKESKDQSPADEQQEKKDKSCTNLESSANRRSFHKKNISLQNPLKSPKRRRRLIRNGRLIAIAMKSSTLKGMLHMTSKQRKKKEKEELHNQPVDKVAEKRKPSKDPANKPLSKKAKRDKFPLVLGKNEQPA